MNARDMDDMLFECKNNAIYVLNTNYAYGEFGRLSLFGASAVNNPYCDPRNGAIGTRSSRNPASTYPDANGLYRSSSANLVDSQHTAEVPHAPATERTSPPAVTIASTPTLPKLFHYSPNEHSDHLLQNHLPAAHHNPQHLPFEAQLQRINPAKSSGVPSPALLTGATTTTTPATISSSKKTSSLKSTIIAKKTKFWKYLEEEKWKKSTSVGNLTTTNCERSSDGNLTRNNGTMIHNMTNHCNNGNSSNNANNNNSSKSSNNRGAVDCTSQKSSTELYKEAAELLGLSCTFCDNCRCLDCQSRYFECDDSDSYSELSFLGDYLDSLDGQPQDMRHCQQFGPSNNAECRSLQSDNSSICSVNSNHSDSP